MNIEEKEQILNNIHKTYMYVSAKKLLEESENDLRKVNRELVQVTHQIENTQNVQNEIRQITFKPNLVNPPKSSIWHRILVGFGVFLGLYFIVDILLLVFANVRVIYNLISYFGLPLIVGATIYLTYTFYKKRDEKATRRYNQPRIKAAEEKTNKARREVLRLDEYVAELQDAREQLSNSQVTLLNDTIPNVRHSFQKLNSDTNPYLISAPAEYRDTPKFYFDLYEVIETGQDKELGAAIKTVVDRLHFEKQTQKIIDSQEETRQLIIEGVKYMTSVVNTGFERIDNQLTNVNTVLNNVNSNLQQLESTVKEQAQTINANLNALNVNMDGLSYQLDNLQNSAWNIEANTSK